MGGFYSCLNNRSKHGILGSSTPSSNVHRKVPESLEGETSTQTVKEKIEHSKSQWSQVANSELEEVEASNVQVFQTLQSHSKWGNFFQSIGKGSVRKLVMGRKFAEGGQAKLYNVKIQWKEPWRNEDDLKDGTKWALKVFKKGTSLQQLQRQWPHGMLQDYADKVEWEIQGNLPELRNQCDVCHGILLKDGRFAFLMVKEHEDLRHHIDHLMSTTKKNHCPFMNTQSVERLIYTVAMAMEWLHGRDIIHGDLKASNVLCTKYDSGWAFFVADFECSIGVSGTGFFRAPEILQACKDHSISDKPELFTKASDVYSYGMLCYEILTGKFPFEDYRLYDFDHVLVGERPKVPKYVAQWMRELLRMCWQSNPVDRPSFGEILKILLANSKRCKISNAKRKSHEAKRAMGIRNSPKRKLPRA